MNVAANIRTIREQKGLLQKQVAASIGLKPAHYNKIETAQREPSLEVLDKLARFFEMTLDELVHFGGQLPQAVVMEDKTATEQLRLLGQLNDKDRLVVMAIIDTMLTKQRFQDFFQQNLATAS